MVTSSCSFFFFFCHLHLGIVGEKKQHFFNSSFLGSTVVVMNSTDLEWDFLDFPPAGWPSLHTEKSSNSDLGPDPIYSVWSVSSRTGCSTSSRTGGSRRCRLRQEAKEKEEEGRRKWRRAGRVKEVSPTCSYWATGNLFSQTVLFNQSHSFFYVPAAACGSVLE